MIHRGPGFLAVPPLPSVSSTGDTQEDWEKEASCWGSYEWGRGVWGAESYDRKKFWYSINHSILIQYSLLKTYLHFLLYFIFHIFLVHFSIMSFECTVVPVSGSKSFKGIKHCSQRKCAKNLHLFMLQIVFPIATSANFLKSGSAAVCEAFAEWIRFVKYTHHRVVFA